MPDQKQEDIGQELKARSQEEYNERMKGKPTPTQEENDRAAMGEHVVEKEDDGSNPDPTGNPGGVLGQSQRGGRQQEHRQSTANPEQRKGYETRQSTPQSGPSGSKPSGGSAA